MQISDPEACREDALASVRGWSAEIRNAILSTPLERITRSRVADRRACCALLELTLPWALLSHA